MSNGLFAIIVCLVVIMFSSILALASIWKKNDKLNKDIEQLTSELHKTKRSYNEVRRMNDDFFYDVCLKEPDEYFIEENPSNICIRARYNKRNLDIKRIYFDLDDEDDKQFAIREAEELIEKLNEGL